MGETTIHMVVGALLPAASIAPVIAGRQPAEQHCLFEPYLLSGGIQAEPVDG
jgi:hypothetical protein